MPIFPWELKVFEVLNQGYHSPFLDGIAKVLSSSITWWIVGLLLLVVGIALKRATILKALLLAGIAISLTDATCTYVLKPLFQRPRPCYVVAETHLTANGCGSFYGLPSNHAANGFGMATAAAFVIAAPWSVAVFGFSVLVALSRTYLGVHLPLDIIVGTVLGVILGGLVGFTAQRVSLRKKKASFA